MEFSLTCSVSAWIVKWNYDELHFAVRHTTKHKRVITREDLTTRGAPNVTASRVRGL